MSATTATHTSSNSFHTIALEVAAFTIAMTKDNPEITAVEVALQFFEQNGVAVTKKPRAASTRGSSSKKDQVAARDASKTPATRCSCKNSPSRCPAEDPHDCGCNSVFDCEGPSACRAVDKHKCSCGLGDSGAHDCLASEVTRQFSEKNGVSISVEGRLPLAEVSPSEWTRDYCRFAFENASVTTPVRSSKVVLEGLHESELTQALCLEAVTQDWFNFRYVPKRQRTPAVYLAVVSHAEWSQKVHEYERTSELCVAAAFQDLGSLSWVNERCLTPGGRLAPFDESYLTPELCLTVVSRDGYELEHVPKNKITPVLCLAAVTQTGYALVFVPNNNRTPDVCLAAVSNTRNALEFVPLGLHSSMSQIINARAKCA